MKDYSVLKDLDLRNDFGHFDERVEHWFETSTHRSYVGRYIGPYGDIAGAATGDRFRHFDPQTGEATFWDHSIRLGEVLAEVRRILPTAQAEAWKPNWGA